MYIIEGTGCDFLFVLYLILYAVSFGMGGNLMSVELLGRASGPT